MELIGQSVACFQKKFFSHGSLLFFSPSLNKRSLLLLIYPPLSSLDLEQLEARRSSSSSSSVQAFYYHMRNILQHHPCMASYMPPSIADVGNFFFSSGVGQHSY